jgi:hypothetical protein
MRIRTRKLPYNAARLLPRPTRDYALTLTTAEPARASQQEVLIGHIRRRPSPHWLFDWRSGMSVIRPFSSSPSFSAFCDYANGVWIAMVPPESNRPMHCLDVHCRFFNAADDGMIISFNPE